MRSFKVKSLAVMLLIALSFSLFVPVMVSAESEASDTLEAAAGGKNILTSPEYITGGEGFGTEGSANLFDYANEDAKYCTDQLPYFAEWKYNRAVVAERILLRTANDNEQSPRRMGDGWTLSGSNDGSKWTVIYTGKEEDVKNVNFKYFTIDLPENKTAYKYYKLNADEAGSAEGQDRNLIQLSMFVLCGEETAIEIGEGLTVVEATNFDSGEYYESNAEDGSHNVRTAEKVQTEFCGDSYVGMEGVEGKNTGNIGWTAADEWVQYTINVAKSGVYQIDAWVASGSDSAGAVEVYCNGNLVGSAQSSNNGWQTYSKISVGSLELPAGTYVIKALFPTGGINFNAFEFIRTGKIPVIYKELTDDLDKEHKIVSLGDSIPAHYGISEDQGYISQLSALLASQGIKNEMINLAQSGSKSSDILELLATEKGQAAVKDADAVTLSIGGNNILAPFLSYIWSTSAMVNRNYYLDAESPALGNFYFNTNPTSNFQFDLTGSNYASVSIEALEKALDREMNEQNMAIIGGAVEEFAIELSQIIEQIKELAPEAVIYVSTVYNPVETASSIYGKIDQILDALNTVIIAGAQDDAYRVVDVASAFAEADRNLTGFDLTRRLYDIHPNRFGHIEISKLYRDAMTGKYVQPVLDIPVETPVKTIGVNELKALAEAIKTADLEALAEAVKAIDFEELAEVMKGINFEAIIKALKAADFGAILEALKSIDFEAFIGA